MKIFTSQHQNQEIITHFLFRSAPFAPEGNENKEEDLETALLEIKELGKKDASLKITNPEGLREELTLFFSMGNGTVEQAVELFKKGELLSQSFIPEKKRKLTKQEYHEGQRKIMELVKQNDPRIEEIKAIWSIVGYTKEEIEKILKKNSPELRYLIDSEIWNAPLPEKTVSVRSTKSFELN